MSLRIITVSFFILFSSIVIFGQKEISSSENSFDMETAMTNYLFYTTKSSGGLSLIFPNGKSLDCKSKAKSPKVEDVFDSIVTCDPRYTWKMIDGVINVAPIEDSALLDAKISEFDVANATDSSLISSLNYNEDFKKSAQNLGLTYEFYYYISQLGRPKTFSVSCKNCTVREILNQAVGKHDNAFWKYQEFELTIGENKGKRVYQIFIK